MKHAKWLLLAILAALLGLLVVQYMVVHPLNMSIYLLLGATVGFLIIVLLA